VIDDFDRRIVNTYMDEYMGDFLFDEFQPFHFYADDTVDYYIPPDGPKEAYQATPPPICTNNMLPILR